MLGAVQVIALKHQSSTIIITYHQYNHQNIKGCLPSMLGSAQAISLKVLAGFLLTVFLQAINLTLFGSNTLDFVCKSIVYIFVSVVQVFLTAHSRPDFHANILKVFCDRHYARHIHLLKSGVGNPGQFLPVQED